MGSYQYVKSYRKNMKHAIVLALGGCCQTCGYNKCEAALEFHHLDANQKDIQISGQSKSILTLGNELKKCIMVCSNCHREIHQGIRNIPTYFMTISDSIIKDIQKQFSENLQNTKWVVGHKFGDSTITKFKNMRWVSDGKVTLKIPLDKLEQYLKSGFHQGRK